jgi:hypothetical protein
MSTDLTWSDSPIHDELTAWELLKEARRERDEARELAHRYRSLYYTQLGIESSASWFPWEGAK